MRNFHRFVTTLLILSTNELNSQSLRYNISMPYSSLGAYSSRQSDPFGFTGNQAALAGVESAGAGVWSERRFMLTETSVYGLAAAVPTKMGNFGLQLNYSGFRNFNDNKIGLAYARRLGKFLDLGIQFNYYGYRIPQYGNASAINFETGVIMHFTEKFHGGLHVYNPAGSKTGKAGDEKLAAAYKIGFGYDATGDFFMSTEIVKEENKPVNVVGGIQYRFMKKFFARAGFSSETGNAFGGAGVGWQNVRIDAAVSHHPQLGFSPGILFIANFKKEKK